ncbi:MAG: carboxypeptidase-like regulatory domain-containing protein [Saprospiraceae bacterium]|nr:carboxypeptidase-like regulatory domain-containing protein [Saprospiraceae bacterium]
MTKQEKTELQKLIGKGQAEEAIEKLLVMPMHASRKKEIIALSARYRKLKQRNRSGLLTFQDLNITENQIQHSLLEFIQEPLDQPLSKERSIDQLYPKRPILWKYLILSTLVLVAFASLAQLLNIVQVWPQASTPLQLTVFVTDTKGNPVLQQEGRLHIPIGNRALNEVIGENGRTNFGDIALGNKGDSIVIGLEAEGWEIVDGKNTFKFTGEPIQLIVKRDNSLGTIKGIVQTRDGQAAIPNALVRINTDTLIRTDSFGVFKIILPPSMSVKRVEDRYLLTVSRTGFETATEYYSPRSSDADIRLIKTN